MFKNIRGFVSILGFYFISWGSRAKALNLSVPKYSGKKYSHFSKSIPGSKYITMMIFSIEKFMKSSKEFNKLYSIPLMSFISLHSLKRAFPKLSKKILDWSGMIQIKTSKPQSTYLKSIKNHNYLQDFQIKKSNLTALNQNKNNSKKLQIIS